jgi:hypothetical protein
MRRNRQMDKVRFIAIGAALLIPVGFLIPHYFMLPNILSVSLVAAIGVCILLIPFLYENLRGRKGQVFSSYFTPLVLTTSFILYNLIVEEYENEKANFLLIILLVNIYTALCILIGIRIANQKA